jgi:MoxR-like ATPase
MPKTQSALLEAMQEHSVTVGGTVHRLEEPFFVMATQNPIEQEGTYPLPEAQLDRFLIKTNVGYPDHDAEVRVLAAEHSGGGVPDVAQVSSPDEVQHLVATARSVHVAPPVMDYIVKLVAHTRRLPELRLGSSPRGAIGLLRASRVAAALDGRSFVVPSDVQLLAGPVLSHRLIASSSHQASGGTNDDVVRGVVASVKAPPGDGRR